jgi:hypothetical protein
MVAKTDYGTVSKQKIEFTSAPYFFSILGPESIPLAKVKLSICTKCLTQPNNFFLGKESKLIGLILTQFEAC